MMTKIIVFVNFSLSCFKGWLQYDFFPVLFHTQSVHYDFIFCVLLKTYIKSSFKQDLQTLQDGISKFVGI